MNESLLQSLNDSLRHKKAMQMTLKGTIREILAAEIGLMPIGEILNKEGLQEYGPRNVASSTMNCFNSPQKAPNYKASQIQILI